MPTTYPEQVEWFESLNQFADANGILFVGSTDMYNFPVNELERNFSVEEAIYNRGVAGLKMAQLPELIDRCILELHPSRIFINMGDEDIRDCNFNKKTFLETYERSILMIRKALPQCVIYIIGILPTSGSYDEVNEEIRRMSRQLNCEFLDFSNVLLNAERKICERYLCNEHTLLPTAYLAILKELKRFFRNRMMGFGDVWNMIDSWY